MLPYLGEGRSKGPVIFQDSFNVGDHVCLADRVYVRAEDKVKCKFIKVTFSRSDLPVMTNALLPPRTESNLGRAVWTQPGP